ncbi:MAG: helix-turn-helix domain-containing protein [Nitrospira sp.]|nr:helix-turn-helix domain-containing protein [Nitrospira sp.]
MVSTKLITIREAAERLGLKESTIRKYILKRQIAYVKPSVRRRIPMRNRTDSGCRPGPPQAAEPLEGVPEPVPGNGPESRSRLSPRVAARWREAQEVASFASCLWGSGEMREYPSGSRRGSAGSPRWEMAVTHSASKYPARSLAPTSSGAHVILRRFPRPHGKSGNPSML